MNVLGIEFHSHISYGVWRSHENVFELRQNPDGMWEASWLTDTEAIIDLAIGRTPEDALNALADFIASTVAKTNALLTATGRTWIRIAIV